MPKSGDSYIVQLRDNHLAWGTYRYTDSRAPRTGEAFILIGRLYLLYIFIYFALPSQQHLEELKMQLMVMMCSGRIFFIALRCEII